MKNKLSANVKRCAAAISASVFLAGSFAVPVCASELSDFYEDVDDYYEELLDYREDLLEGDVWDAPDFDDDYVRVVPESSIEVSSIDLTAADELSADAYIGTTKAKNAALKAAGLKSSNVTFTKTKLSSDDGVYEYEVDFTVKKSKDRFEYDIDANTGAVRSFERKLYKVPTKKTKITLSKAKSIAIKDAGLKASNVKYTKTKLERDGMLYEYDIYFTDSVGNAYEYEIEATAGTIIGYEKKTAKQSQSTSDKNITKEKAKQLAVDYAKSYGALTSSSVTFTKVKLDYDHGRYVYEIEFRKGWMEYEIDIDARTGDILDFEFDYD